MLDKAQAVATTLCRRADGSCRELLGTARRLYQNGPFGMELAVALDRDRAHWFCGIFAVVCRVICPR